MLVYRQEEKRLRKVDNDISDGETGFVGLSEMCKNKTPIGYLFIHWVVKNIQEDFIKVNYLLFQHVRKIVEENWKVQHNETKCYQKTEENRVSKPMFCETKPCQGLLLNEENIEDRN